MHLLFADLSVSYATLAASHRASFPLHLGWHWQPALALIAGILILIRPKFLNFIVAAYLIVIGVIGLVHWTW